MELVFRLALILVTSFGAYALARRYAAGSMLSFRRSLLMVLECMGAAVLFFGLNLAVGVVLLFLLRALTRTFVPLYAVGDSYVILLSLFQGLTFQMWWQSRRPT
jgi:hypothetical protein